MAVAGGILVKVILVVLLGTVKILEGQQLYCQFLTGFECLLLLFEDLL